MAEVIWTTGARNDLQEIVDYIAQDSPTYAAVMANRIIAAVERLERHARLGRIVPEYEDPSVRELIVGMYRIVYRVRGRRTGVVAVLHGSRDLLRKLPGESWDSPWE